MESIFDPEFDLDRRAVVHGSGSRKCSRLSKTTCVQVARDVSGQVGVQ
jgi:hypothetical protein